MKKIFLLLIALPFNQHLTFAQDQHLVDSLTHELLIHKQDTTAANILYALSKVHWDNNPGKALDYASQTLKLSKKINYKTGIGNAYNSLGAIERNKGNYSTALEHYKKSLDIRLQIGDKRDIARSYNNIGEVYRLQGNYDAALKQYFTSLKIKEEIGDKEGIAVSLNSIGIIYKEQENYKNALKNYFSSLKIKEEIGDKKGIASCYNNIGEVYRLEGLRSEALSNYLKALVGLKESHDIIAVGTCYNNIAGIYQDEAIYQDALENYFNALKIQESLEDKEGIVRTCINIGGVYIELKNYDSASKYLKRAFSVSKAIGSFVPNNYNYYNYLSRLDSAQGNFKKSLEDFKLFVKNRDSLSDNETVIKMTQLQMQYDFDKKEAKKEADQDKKDLLTKAEIQKQKVLRNNIAVGAGIILVASFVSFIFYRRKRDAQMQADISSARVKTMTAQIEKHFVFGSLSSVKNLIAENPDKATELITRSSKFLRTTLNLSESTTISLKQELEATENYLQIEKIHHEDKFDFKIIVEEGIHTEKIMVPPLIFQPIVENSIKHGFHGIDYKGQIDINISKSGSQLICKIADNGVGFKSETDSDHKSFGTKLTRERLELFNKLHKQKAMFNIQSLTQGVLVTLTLPV